MPCLDLRATSSTSALLIASGQASAQNSTNTTSSNGVTITFLHVNDVHNRIEGATA
jgi:2',3'-cyclic-nucleotide 2'-phosphodiesterase (5'-nucleotidase family)